MAGPQLQQRHHPMSFGGGGGGGGSVGGSSIGGGDNIGGNSICIASTSTSSAGLHALRQISDQNDLIYRGSTTLPHCSNGGNSTVGASTISRGVSSSVSAQNTQQSASSTALCRPGTSSSDALIVPGSHSNIEIVDATKSVKSDDVEQGQRKVRHKHRPIFRRLVNYVRGLFQGSSTTNDSELEEFETPARYRPDSLSALSRATRFTEDEIKRIYRGFKAECPTGVVKEDTFKVIYSTFFPQGGSCANPTLYAHYVFNTLDQDHSGIVSFEDFVQGLSVLSRGSNEEKLRWTFSLYDINGDGFITRDEMTDIVTAIYELMGRVPDECPEEEKIRHKVERIFRKMDTNRDGVVTLEEFLECCHNDEAISRSMSVFDTAF